MARRLTCMNRIVLAIACLVVAVGSIACGSPDEEPTPPPAAGGGSPADPESPVTMTPEPGSSVHDVGGQPERVRPRPGMADVRPVPWESAHPTPDRRHLRIVFWSGVEPCNVLDHVEIEYAPDEITVTLFEGSDPEQPDVACIEVALRKVVRVALDEPIDGRPITDGAK